MELFATADTLADLRDQKKKAEDALKEINEMIAQTEEQLVAAMLEEEMQNFTRNGKQFILTSRTYASAKSGMMPDICDWMKDNDLGDMVKESIHPQTLQA